MSNNKNGIASFQSSWNTQRVYANELSASVVKQSTTAASTLPSRSMCQQSQIQGQAHTPQSIRLQIDLPLSTNKCGSDNQQTSIRHHRHHQDLKHKQQQQQQQLRNNCCSSIGSTSSVMNEQQQQQPRSGVNTICLQISFDTTGLLNNSTTNTNSRHCSSASSNGNGAMLLSRPCSQNGTSGCCGISTHWMNANEAAQMSCSTTSGYSSCSGLSTASSSSSSSSPASSMMAGHLDALDEDDHYLSSSSAAAADTFIVNDAADDNAAHAALCCKRSRQPIALCVPASEPMAPVKRQRSNVYDRLHYVAKARRSSLSSSSTSTSSLSSVSTTNTSTNDNQWPHAAHAHSYPTAAEQANEGGALEEEEEDIYEQITSFYENLPLVKPNVSSEPLTRNGRSNALPPPLSPSLYEKLNEFCSDRVASATPTFTTVKKSNNNNDNNNKNTLNCSTAVATLQASSSDTKSAVVSKAYRREYTINEIFQNLKHFKEQAKQQEDSLNSSSVPSMVANRQQQQQQQLHVQTSETSKESNNEQQQQQACKRVRDLKQIFEVSTTSSGSKAKSIVKTIDQPSAVCASVEHQSRAVVQPLLRSQHTYVNEKVSRPINV